jgi:hypothetical protein
MRGDPSPWQRVLSQRPRSARRSARVAEYVLAELVPHASGRAVFSLSYGMIHSLLREEPDCRDLTRSVREGEARRPPG